MLYRLKCQYFLMIGMQHSIRKPLSQITPHRAVLKFLITSHRCNRRGYSNLIRLKELSNEYVSAGISPWEQKRLHLY